MAHGFRPLLPGLPPPLLLLLLLSLSLGVVDSAAPGLELLRQVEADGPVTVLHAYRGAASLWLSGHDAVENQLQVWGGRAAGLTRRFSLNDTTAGRPSSAAAVLAIDSCRPGLVATAAYDGTVATWRWAEEESALRLMHAAPAAAGGHRLAAAGVQLSADCRFAVSVGMDGTRLWAVSPAGTLSPLDHLPDLPATAVAFHQSPPTFYVGGPRGLAALCWGQSKWTVTHTYPEVEGITSLSVSPDGHLLFAGAEDGRIAIWKVGSEPELLDAAAVEAAEVVGVWASRSGKMLVSSSIDQVVRVWRVLSPAALRLQYTLDAGTARAMDFPIDIVRGVALSPEDDETLLLGSWSRLVALALPRPSHKSRRPTDGLPSHADPAEPRETTFLDLLQSVGEVALAVLELLS
eukprot:EG_transcript_13377